MIICSDISLSAIRVAAAPQGSAQELKQRYSLLASPAGISGSYFTCDVNSSPSYRFGNLGVVDALRNKSL